MKHKIIVVFLIRCANSVLESHNTGYAQKAVEVQLPLKPKKPTPPFFQFLQERRNKVVKEHKVNMKGIGIIIWIIVYKDKYNDNYYYIALYKIISSFIIYNIINKYCKFKTFFYSIFF